MTRAIVFTIGVIVIAALLASCQQFQWMGITDTSPDPADHIMPTPEGSNYPYQTIKDGKEQREVIIQYFRDMGLEPPTPPKENE